MTYEPKSIAEHIDCLARLTGAPGSFVDQVRRLFTTKGISLDDEAAPFLEALDEAFRREENIRSSSYRARQNLAKVEEDFRKVGQAYVEQLSQLKKIQSNLRDQTQRTRKKFVVQRTETHQVTIRGDHRTLVTRTEREDLPMVPGPRDVQ